MEISKFFRLKPKAKSADKTIIHVRPFGNINRVFVVNPGGYIESFHAVVCAYMKLHEVRRAGHLPASGGTTRRNRVDPVIDPTSFAANGYAVFRLR
jgi:hypothetical protein